MLNRPPPETTTDRLREQRIAQVHPLLDTLKASLLAIVPYLDDFGEGDRFDLLLLSLPDQGALYLPFDAALLDGLLYTLRCTSDANIFPTYYSIWAHKRTYYLRETEDDFRQMLSTIRIRRDPQTLPRLDDSIWMGHEVGHQLIFDHYELLKQLFDPAWQKYQAEMLHAAMNAGGQRKTVLDQRHAQMQLYWGLESEKTNWTHELVIDTLCVWVFGSAYLWAFVDEHLSDPQQFAPHQLDTHPPRRARVEALQQAAVQLGWNAADLQPLLDAWQTLPADASESNRYSAFLKPYLILGAQQAAMQMARQLRIPQLRPEGLDRLDPDAIPAGPLFVRDLILSAWKQRTRLYAVQELEAWERRTLGAAMAEVVPGEA